LRTKHDRPPPRHQTRLEQALSQHHAAQAWLAEWCREHGLDDVSWSSASTSSAVSL
jgi:hypothetical protein